MLPYVFLLSTLNPQCLNSYGLQLEQRTPVDIGDGRVN